MLLHLHFSDLLGKKECHSAKFRQQEEDCYQLHEMPPATFLLEIPEYAATDPRLSKVVELSKGPFPTSHLVMWLPVRPRGLAIELGGVLLPGLDF